MFTTIVIICLVLLLIGIYNGIIKRMNAAQRAWAVVITQERQKNNILPKLEEIVTSSEKFERGLLIDIVALRSDVESLSSSKIDAGQLKSVESKMSSIVKGVQLTVEAYPELKTVELMNNLMAEISEQQENIGAAIRIYNSNVESFNNGIQVFPNNLVNRYVNKLVKLNVFDDSEASVAFEYQPNFDDKIQPE